MGADVRRKVSLHFHCDRFESSLWQTVTLSEKVSWHTKSIISFFALAKYSRSVTSLIQGSMKEHVLTVIVFCTIQRKLRVIMAESLSHLAIGNFFKFLLRNLRLFTRRSILALFDSLVYVYLAFILFDPAACRHAFAK